MKSPTYETRWPPGAARRGGPGGPPLHTLAVQLSSTRRGARLARRLAVQHLAEWGIPYDAPAAQSAALVTAELAANAVRHCGGLGRDFRLRLLCPSSAGMLRVEITDACADRPLPPGRERTPASDAESGYGLLLVDALAVHWGSTVHDLVTKTVWAELELPAPVARMYATGV